MDASSPLIPEICLGFEYSDCAVDDSRLVILNAMQAREHGAELMTRTRCVCAEVVEGMGAFVTGCKRILSNPC